MAQGWREEDPLGRGALTREEEKEQEEVLPPKEHPPTPLTDEEIAEQEEFDPDWQEKNPYDRSMRY